jgi:hypothetical protein
VAPWCAPRAQRGNLVCAASSRSWPMDGKGPRSAGRAALCGYDPTPARAEAAQRFAGVLRECSIRTASALARSR